MRQAHTRTHAAALCLDCDCALPIVSSQLYFCTHSLQPPPKPRWARLLVFYFASAQHSMRNRDTGACFAADCSCALSLPLFFCPSVVRLPHTILLHNFSFHFGCGSRLQLAGIFTSNISCLQLRLRMRTTCTNSRGKNCQQERNFFVNFLKNDKGSTAPA